MARNARFAAGWLALTAFGWAVGWSLFEASYWLIALAILGGDSLSMAALSYASGPIQGVFIGLTVGLLQAPILFRSTPRRLAGVVATAAGWGVGWLLVFLVAYVLQGSGLIKMDVIGATSTVVLWCLAGTFGAFLAAIGQSLVAGRATIAALGWPVFASIAGLVGWAAARGLFEVIQGTPRSPGVVYSLPASFTLGCLGGLLFAIVSIPIVLQLRAPKPVPA